MPCPGADAVRADGRGGVSSGGRARLRGRRVVSERLRVAHVRVRDARVRRLLLSVLTSLYERHQSPKQLVKLHSLAPLLERIQESDPALLVRKVASELYEAFKTHDLL